MEFELNSSTNNENSRPSERGVQSVAQEHQECSICLFPMCSKPASFLLSGNGRRVCSHYFHQECLEQWERTCPCCRKSYQSTRELADPINDPEAFYRALDVDGNNSLDKTELQAGLLAVLPLDHKKIERDSATLWRRWDTDGNDEISLDEFTAENDGVLAYLKRVYARHTQRNAEVPDINCDPQAWFNYFDEDQSHGLDKSEVTWALCKTFHKRGVEAIRAMEDFLNNIWFLVDTDGSGAIEMNEFVETLQPTIIAELNHQRNNENHNETNS